MKRMKKVFAVLLTLAMVLGMSITVFADLGTAVIPVNGAKEGTQYQYLQLIRPQSSEKEILAVEELISTPLLVMVP